MTKILIRSGIAPFESPTYEQIITTSLLGGNLGNLLYDASIFKTLYVNKNMKQYISHIIFLKKKLIELIILVNILFCH